MKRLNHLSKLTILGLTISLALPGCSSKTAEETISTVSNYKDATVINLSNDSASIDGTEVEEFDYTWHCDPTTLHDVVENAPAEYYTGTEANTDSAVYIDHELFYYPQLNETDFKLVNYDGEQEWAYYYSDGENDDYIFGTLPRLGQSLPSQMMHSEEEAAQNKVLKITEAGTYVLSGSWDGQIKVDLGDEDETFTNQDAKVTLILNGVNIKCTVAPGVIFENVYECDNTWEDAETHTNSVDTTNAGANIIIADNTDNYISGTNVFRMLKTKYKDEDSTDEIKTQKKMRKTDGALYSYQTMNISGESENSGKLTVESGFEGIDSELHMNISGGNITIKSQDDGMNVNEDHVSVLMISGGEITINAALGSEGDGIDSNGYVVLNDGTLNVNGIRVPDNAIDSEDGITYNGGVINIDGQAQNYETGSTFQETNGSGNMNRPNDMDRPNDMTPPGDMAPSGDMTPPDGNNGMAKPDDANGPRGMMNNENFDMKSFKEKIAALSDDATFDDVMNALNESSNRPE